MHNVGKKEADNGVDQELFVKHGHDGEQVIVMLNVAQGSGVGHDQSPIGQRLRNGSST